LDVQNIHAKVSRSKGFFRIKSKKYSLKFALSGYDNAFVSCVHRKVWIPSATRRGQAEVIQIGIVLYFVIFSESVVLY